MKLLLGFMVGIAILIIIVLLYCALKITGCSGKNDDKFCKEQICPKCKIGKHTYEIDSKSDVCPYISYWKNGKCAFYAPLKKSPDTDK